MKRKKYPRNDARRGSEPKQERDAVIYRAKNIRYYCDIAEASEFGKLMWGQGCREQADWARELIFVCDGATWIWKLVEQYYPQAVQIVDWYHAEERLERVAQEASPIARCARLGSRRLNPVYGKGKWQK